MLYAVCAVEYYCTVTWSRTLLRMHCPPRCDRHHERGPDRIDQRRYLLPRNETLHGACDEKPAPTKKAHFCWHRTTGTFVRLRTFGKASVAPILCTSRK